LVDKRLSLAGCAKSLALATSHRSRPLKRSLYLFF
jgi:hypothetical protein